MELNELIGAEKNKWHNVYWFARMLINRDKYMAIGNEPKLLSLISSSLKLTAEQNIGKDTLSLQKQVLRNTIEDRYKKTTTKTQRIQRLLSDLDKEITSPELMDIFITTCENIMIPLQQAISNIPSDDRAFTVNIAKSFLDVKGKKLLKTLNKYYLVDIGLRYFLLGDKKADRGHILENVVYLELLRRGYKVYIGEVKVIENHGEKRTIKYKQVDFAAEGLNGVEYYQVSDSVRDEATLTRELVPLDAIRDHNPKFLLTTDYDPHISHNGIKQLNVYDWLLR
ncbi:hypothetical protein AGMMS50212_14930 [Spirochaetia bacterium]|nr:hypothetical protein AGMMS50212_14930 [Spirochaetia bacterium]